MAGRFPSWSSSACTVIRSPGPSTASWPCSMGCASAPTVPRPEST
ncbi:Uncharacterised protein [Mycobacteroides abscessus subsp. abscessus]|nr:Uncharacterised protein [Mycobacteroides abscessus subsp. abscessus]